ncbi:ATP-dependent RNA helicase CHL1 [Scheffersomyces xylosifermentans]|uniref:ATP-dependent RNA helicase CHL1 n=1 Tax=Scheffersomyces xylosifermentans TaxID=1304137 RepID=UPI00315DAFE9
MNTKNESNRYNHPYKPYQIQLDLMDAIYDTIENGYKVGIFESPTGTGKTLSIICSCMTWLRDYKRNNVFTETGSAKDINNDSNDSFEDSDDEPEWVKQAYINSILSRTKNKMVDYEKYLDEIKADYIHNVQKAEEIHTNQRKRTKRIQKDSVELRDDDFLPVDYYSDSEVSSTIDQKNAALGTEINQLLQKVSGKTDDIEMTNDCPVNIFFSSRTHSQLNQFSHQLRLTSFNSSVEGIDERTKYLALGSRKQLCINDKVKKLSKNDLNLNDACVDLQKSKEGCDFLPKDYMSSSLTKKLADLSMTEVYDIEELGDLGTELKVCPYYTARRGIEMTEIASLPYQMLLQETTRSVLNLKIEDSIVVIDEAHNLLDVISSIHSVSINIEEIQKIIKSLRFYLSKFIKRLNSGNRIHLMKLIKLCQLLICFIQEQEKEGSNKIGREIKVEDIFHNSTGDMLNIHKIETFLAKSKIAYKIESYMEKKSNGENSKSSSSNPLLFKMVKFLKSLVNPSREGKFFWDIDNGSVSINYLLLDPSAVFKEIVSKARCVLLCGGTMEPMSDFKNYLFPYVDNTKIKTFSCSHIIPQENLKVFPIASNDGVDLEFSFDKRNSISMIASLGEAVLKICQNVPGGVVVFFPSYKYLNQVLKAWKDQSYNLLNRIEKYKKVFQEPTNSSHVETVLSDYSKSIKEENKGAILLSVVGGKMSEGINFSDELGRAVIMVGLPYPNAYSGELIAKRNFIESETIARGGSPQEATRNSQGYYENICMRAVNQSIGRSIRHINDYSIIYLIDGRYRSPSIQNKLSNWVKEKIQLKQSNLAEILEETKEFFDSKSISRLG